MFRDDATCPLCGHPNRCELVEGRGNCWCFPERVDSDLVEWLASCGLSDRCLCRACAVEGVRSPCIGECGLDRETQACVGCQRTLGEIGGWSRMTSIERGRAWMRLRGV